MRKTALTITISTLVLGVFGAFLRWLQEMNLYEPETALARTGAPISIVLVVYAVLAAAAMLVLSVLVCRKTVCSPDANEALRAETPIPRVLSVVCALLTLLAGLQQMFTAGASPFALMQRIFGAGALVSAGAILALPGKRGGDAGSLSGTAATWLPVFFSYSLVLAYRENAQDPVLWHYGPFMLAIALNAVAYYHVAAWYFRRAIPRRALFSVQLAVFLDLCALSDSRSLWPKLLLIAAAGMLLCAEFLLIANRTEKTEEPAPAPAEAEAGE